MVGVCAALELARRGADVTLLERGGELAWACSSGNAGLICPSHATPFANRAALRDGLRWMWKQDSPLYLRPRLGVLPWLARFARAATSPARVEATTRTIRELSSASLRLHEELADGGLDTGLRQARLDERLRKRRGVRTAPWPKRRRIAAQGFASRCSRARRRGKSNRRSTRA